MAKPYMAICGVPALIWAPITTGAMKAPYAAIAEVQPNTGPAWVRSKSTPMVRKVEPLPIPLAVNNTMNSAMKDGDCQAVIKSLEREMQLAGVLGEAARKVAMEGADDEEEEGGIGGSAAGGGGGAGGSMEALMARARAKMLAEDVNLEEE